MTWNRKNVSIQLSGSFIAHLAAECANDISTIVADLEPPVVIVPEPVSEPYAILGLTVVGLNVTMSWTDETPRTSRLAYQIKVGKPTTETVEKEKRKIPEPGAIAGLFTIGVLSIGPRKLKVNHT